MSEQLPDDMEFVGLPADRILEIRNFKYSQTLGEVQQKQGEVQQQHGNTLERLERNQQGLKEENKVLKDLLEQILARMS